jgi:HTH-type transcriptional regulator, competence development regulator
VGVPQLTSSWPRSEVEPTGSGLYPDAIRIRWDSGFPRAGSAIRLSDFLLLEGQGNHLHATPFDMDSDV